MNTRQIGEYYERLACEFLIANGCEIVTTNYDVYHVGEIDVIAKFEKVLTNGQIYPTLLCVEVRARQHKKLVSAVETVTKTKQKRLIATMSHFLQTFDDYANFDVRFDVLAFNIGDENCPCEWVQGAFLVE